MTSWVNFLKIRYRQGKVTDWDLSDVNVPKGIKNSKKLTTGEINEIKNAKKGKKK